MMTDNRQTVIEPSGSANHPFVQQARISLPPRQPRSADPNHPTMLGHVEGGYLSGLLLSALA